GKSEGLGQPGLHESSLAGGAHDHPRLFFSGRACGKCCLTAGSGSPVPIFPRSERAGREFAGVRSFGRGRSPEPASTQAEAQWPGDPRIYAVANENGEFRVERKSSLPSADYLFYASCVSDIAEVAIGPPYSEALIGTGGPFAGRPVHAEADREVDL